MRLLNSKAKDFVSRHRVCALAVELDDGTPHNSAVHFANDSDCSEFYIFTERGYKKCEPLLGGKSAKASIVIGLDDGDMKTLQTDGQISIVSDRLELEKIQKVYFSKLPKAEKYKDEPESIFLKFTPTWWRYTEWSNGDKEIVSSRS